MNWFKIVSSGLVVWIIPFVFCTFIFPEIPANLQFVLYLLVCCFVLIDFNNSTMSGYLQKRNKITIQVGFALGISWFVIACLGSASYYLLMQKMPLLDFAMLHSSFYLIYPIMGITIGICEERRGRRR
jgi:hypothetical protein